MHSHSHHDDPPRSRASSLDISMSLRLISRRSCLQTLALLLTITLPSLTHAFLHPQPTLAGLSLRMAPPGHVTTRPAGQRWIPRAVPNKAAHNRFCHSLTSLRMTEETGEKDAATIEAQKKFDDLVAKNAAKEAINVLRGNDDVEVAPDQGWRLLNSIPLEMSEKTETEQQILTSLAYSSLRKKSLLRAFGCVEPSPLYLPYASKEIDVPMLEKTISLPMKALTPRGTQFAWQFAGLLICTAEYAIASKLGLDPLRTVIPLTAAAFVVDRVALSGALFESFYRLFFPLYKEKVIKHEAGHFLLAYLMGCPIQGFFLSAWDATRAGIRGQAGTVFFDNDLSTQLNANKVTRAAIDRYTIVLMGGIAAEAINYEQAEGGASDESALVNFLIGLTPAWSQQRVLNQARWAVTEAVLLLREHQAAFDVLSYALPTLCPALAEAMAANKPLGECVQAIETALPSQQVLPSEARATLRRQEGYDEPPPTAPQDLGDEPNTTMLLEEIESQLEERRAKLDQIKQQEEELQQQMRALDSEGSGLPGDNKAVWDKSETQRFMDTLLKANRKRKAAAAQGKKSVAGGGGGAEGDKDGRELDRMLAEAGRSKQLAEIDLELTQKRLALSKIEEQIAKLSGPPTNGADRPKD